MPVFMGIFSLILRQRPWQDTKYYLRLFPRLNENLLPKNCFAHSEWKRVKKRHQDAA